MQQLTKILSRLALGLVGAVVLGVGAAALYLDHYLDSATGPGAAPVEFRIEKGQSFRTVSRALAARDIITKPWLLDFYARWTGRAGRIHAGDYLLAPGATPRDLLEQFLRGDVRLFSFTLVEGWNQWDLQRAIAARPELEATLGPEDWG
ncbi:MAG: endolytic transglycosylase MltG, partial [Woeseiaceae bacterium]|nr:endolytic transglycosylase MltG [Woeseiaceae bacterium]